MIVGMHEAITPIKRVADTADGRLTWQETEVGNGLHRRLARWGGRLDGERITDAELGQRLRHHQAHPDVPFWF